MPTLKIVQPVTGKNGVTLPAGTVRDFPEEVAQKLIDLGLARTAPASPLIVRCGNCVHFIPDPINPPAGIGDCDAKAWRPNRGMPPQYPMVPRRCEVFEERAAIKEYDGRMDRGTAEREAEEEGCELFQRKDGNT